MDTVKSIQGKITGVIIPPPEIRAVVDKTAAFVAKIGKSFEQRVLASEEGKTAKFNFMRPFDPYHAYYEMKIREGEEGKSGSAPSEESKNSDSAHAAKTSEENLEKEKAKAALPTTVATAVKASIVNPIAQLAKTKPTEPSPELEFSVAQSHPAGLSPFDVDVIKLVAQYTAVNGREFLAGVAMREQRNPQFDFLKPTHMLFSYFTYLVDCYAKILHPSAALKETIEAKSNWHTAMEGAVRRWQWTRAEAERRRSENSEDSEERLAFQAIDWFDFTVVETIDFPEGELLELDVGSAGAVQDAAANPSSNGHAVPPPAPVAPARSAPSSYFAPTQSNTEEDEMAVQEDAAEVEAAGVGSHHQVVQSGFAAVDGGLLAALADPGQVVTHVLHQVQGETGTAAVAVVGTLGVHVHPAGAGARVFLGAQGAVGEGAGIVQFDYGAHGRVLGARGSGAARMARGTGRRLRNR